MKEDKNSYYRSLVESRINGGIGYELLTNLEKLDVIAAKTKLTLRDLYTSEIITRQVKTVIKQDFKSSVVKLEESKEGYLISRGVPEKYAEGTEFYRDPLQSKIWYYVCGICSKDEYVSEKLCNGVFKMDISHMSAGRKSCRCSNTYKWTLPQRDLQMRSICKERNHRFIQWTDKSKTSSHCRFEWECEYGHICEMSVDNYRRGKGCKHCAISTGNGYFPSRRGELDVLYVTKINEDKTNVKNYFKVGRSFNPTRRMYELKREVKKKDNRDIDFYPVIYLFGKHAEIYKLEQDTHETFKDCKPANGYGSSELIHNSAFMDVLDYLERSGYPMSISETIYKKAEHEINMCEWNGTLGDVFNSLLEGHQEDLSDEGKSNIMVQHFIDKVWKREFSTGATRERIRGTSVPIETGEITDYEEK